MGDVVSIEILLDPESEARVRADWAALERAGMSSLGAHRSASNRPHVTVLARPSLRSVSFAAAVALLPVQVSLGEPSVFAYGDRGVLVRQIEPSAELLRLHRTVHEAALAREDEPAEDAAYTRPGEWTPHVTLARRLKLSQLPETLALLGPAHSGLGLSLRRWDSATATVTDLSEG